VVVSGQRDGLNWPASAGCLSGDRKAVLWPSGCFAGRAGVLVAAVGAATLERLSELKGGFGEIEPRLHKLLLISFKNDQSEPIGAAPQRRDTSRKRAAGRATKRGRVCVWPPGATWAAAAATVRPGRRRPQTRQQQQPPAGWT
jgi:hypothetical protein